MDVIAHGLWVGIGLAAVAHRRPIGRRIAVATVAMAVVPDLLQFIPVLAAAIFAPGGFELLADYASALPGFEPVLPPWAATLTHHLHCVMHSAIVAAAISLLVFIGGRTWWLPLSGWWSHIVIDVFTHSADFYPAPVLYPFTYWGFDGIAWNQPWFMATNYVAMGVAMLMLLWRRRPRGRST
jgi:hypothetical protein